MDADKIKLKQTCMLIVFNLKRHGCWSGTTATYMPDGLVKNVPTGPLVGYEYRDITAGLRQAYIPAGSAPQLQMCLQSSCN